MNFTQIKKSIERDGYLSQVNYNELVSINPDNADVICKLCCCPNDFDMLHHLLGNKKIYGDISSKVLVEVYQSPWQYVPLVTNRDKFIEKLQNNIPLELHCFHTCQTDPVIILEFGTGFPRNEHCPNCGEHISCEKDLTYELVEKTK